MWTINGNWKMSAWSFPVRPVKAGHSLINTGAGKLPFETVRTSIGSLGNYTTVYNLIILNSQKQIVPFLRCYQYYCYEMPDICYYQYKFTTDSTGTLKLLAGLFDNSGPIYFADSNTDTPVVNSPHSFEVAGQTPISTQFFRSKTLLSYHLPPLLFPDKILKIISYACTLQPSRNQEQKLPLYLLFRRVPQTPLSKFLRQSVI